MTEKDYYERYWENQFGSDQRDKCKKFKEDSYRWNESTLQVVLSLLQWNAKWGSFGCRMW